MLQVIRRGLAKLQDRKERRKEQFIREGYRAQSPEQRRYIEGAGWTEDKLVDSVRFALGGPAENSVMVLTATHGMVMALRLKASTGLWLIYEVGSGRLTVLEHRHMVYRDISWHLIHMLIGNLENDEDVRVQTITKHRKGTLQDDSGPEKGFVG